MTKIVVSLQASHSATTRQVAPSVYKHARILEPGRYTISRVKNSLTCEVYIKSTEYLNFWHFRHFEF
jgi:hypothetical protein